jgi:hypothetical protein
MEKKMAKVLDTRRRPNNANSLTRNTKAPSRDRRDFESCQSTAIRRSTPSEYFRSLSAKSSYQYASDRPLIRRRTSVRRMDTQIIYVHPRKELPPFESLVA